MKRKYAVGVAVTGEAAATLVPGTGGLAATEDDTQPPGKKSVHTSGLNLNRYQLSHAETP